jgi:hypothetical protein
MKKYTMMVLLSSTEKKEHLYPMYTPTTAQFFNKHRFVARVAILPLAKPITNNCPPVSSQKHEEENL